MNFTTLSNMLRSYTVNINITEDDLVDGGTRQGTAILTPLIPNERIEKVPAMTHIFILGGGG